MSAPRARAMPPPAAGPFTAAMIKRLTKYDWRLLRAAQQELDSLGEAGPAAALAS